MGRTCASIALAFFFVGCAFTTYTFLTPSAGQIAFGSDINGANFSVINPTTSADQNANIGIAAVFSRSVTGVTQLAIQRADEAPLTTNLPSFADASDRVAFHYGLRALPGPGRYVFRIMVGSEVLASGELDVTAPSASLIPQG